MVIRCDVEFVVLKNSFLLRYCGVVDKEILKFWKQRKHLFYKYEDGILLDHESWYSVRPLASLLIELRRKQDKLLAQALSHSLYLLP